jgi:acetyltransferase
VSAGGPGHPSLRIRPIRPEDAPAYERFIGAIAAEDLRMRFERGAPAQDLARYTRIDAERETAFVAVAADAPEEILGEVRIFPFPDGATAEFAILVRSDAQRRGIGRALLGKAIDYSRTRGAAALIGQMHPDNRAMIGLARACSMEVEHTPGASVAVAHLDL